jgi:hypothetical protein
LIISRITGSKLSEIEPTFNAPTITMAKNPSFQAPSKETLSLFFRTFLMELFEQISYFMPFKVRRPHWMKKSWNVCSEFANESGG